MKPGTDPNLRCHHCGTGDLRIAPGYAETGRVTSDCKPWPPGGILALCQSCGLVQTIVNELWRKECDQIYHGYTIYHQSGGIEQAVFDSGSGAAVVRSEAIVNGLLAHEKFPSKGRWLDIGCGNGALLRAVSRALPQWSLNGSEVSDKYRSVVESIPGVEKMHTGAIEGIPGTFDVVSLIHVIEHIAEPAVFLRSLASKLNPGGWLLLEVPDCRQNFFALMIADHCSHFSAGMLANIAASAGYQVQHAVDNWVSKEITVVARAGSGAGEGRAAPMNESEAVFGGWPILRNILAQVQPLAKGSRFGIFGSSIAGTWLDAQTGRAAQFFVDEDQSRIGKQHFGRPIVASKDIPGGSKVYIALPPVVARRVAERLRALKPAVEFVTP